jgi:hypothetical protein
MEMALVCQWNNDHSGGKIFLRDSVLPDPVSSDFTEGMQDFEW